MGKKALEADYIGKKFGYLTVLCFGEEYLGRTVAHCRCYCGNYSLPMLTKLKAKVITSCGCRRPCTVHRIKHAPPPDGEKVSNMGAPPRKRIVLPMPQAISELQVCRECRKPVPELVEHSVYCKSCHTKLKPLSRIKDYPCENCIHGMYSLTASMEWECRKECMRSCAPWQDMNHFVSKYIVEPENTTDEV